MNESKFNQHHNESKGETELLKEKSVGFLFDCGTVSQLLDRVDKMVLETNTNTVMLNEYDLSVQDVNLHLRDISDKAKDKSIDIIMAPDISKGNQQWEDIKKDIEALEAVLLDEEIDPAEVRDSVGYVFKKDGSIFVFPKSWEHPIHQIPNSNEAVSICGEIGNINPEDLGNLDIKLIYNPSKENDDPNVKFRMMGLSNPDITDHEIWDELMKDSWFKNLTENDSVKTDYSHFDKHYRKILEEEDAKDDALDDETKASQIEANKQQAQDHFEMIKRIVRNQNTEPSMYVRNISAALEAKGITVIRSDGRTSSGVLNPSERTKIKDWKSDDESAHVNIVFNQ